MARPYSIKDAIHRDSALSIAIEKQGNNYYFAMIPLRPSTPVIVNEAIADDLWHPIATGLTDVMEWRLSERAGQDFYFAFTAAPATYATAYGWCGGQNAITDIYAKRKNAVANLVELVYWKV